MAGKVVKRNTARDEFNAKWERNGRGHTAAHKLMIADGAPAAMFVSPERRAKAWVNRPLTVVPFIKLRRDESDEAKAVRAQLKQDGIIALKNRLARSAVKKVLAKIDHSKMRWDSKRAKFVEDCHVSAPNQGLARLPERPAQTKSTTTPHGRIRPVSKTMDASGQDWSRVNKATAMALAELNGVWDDKYVKLSGGLLVMTITNRLKGLVKRGEEVKWH